MARRSAPLARLLALAFVPVGVAQADTSYQTLPFSQDWTTITLITANDNWSGVPGVVGFLGQDITTSTGVNPQTLTGVSANASDVDVIANQTNPNTLTAGGVAEFHITNPVVALQGSGTADAPYLLLHLDTSALGTINISYNLRDVDGSADNTNMQVALQYRVGDTGPFVDVPAGYVADASTGPSLATLVTPVSVNLSTASANAVDNQPQLQVRIITTNAAGSDEWIGVDDISVTGVALPEGPPAVSSTVPANNAVGVAVSSNIAINFNELVNVTGSWFTISCTASGAHTATVTGGPRFFTLNPDIDFANGETCTVTINRMLVTDQDASDPPDEMVADHVFTFRTIPVLAIHQIQGSGNQSPFSGEPVITEGIVTARRGAGGVGNDGYFLQSADADADADPATSQGIFVFTGSGTGAPAEAVVGARLRVQGTVAEFVTSSDPFSPPITELVGPFVVSQISTGNALPAAVALDPALPDPAGSIEQLERYEGMRLALPAVTVVSPTDGFVNESTARSTSDGTFTVVRSTAARPFREPGLEAPELPPAGTIPPIPRFDGNPERIRIDSDRQVGATAIDVDVDTTLTGLVGVVDYAFRTYTLLPDPGITVAQTGGKVPVAVAAPTGREFTVGTYNLERFFDTVDDPAIGDPVLSASAFADRVEKAKRGICQFMRAPDVVGVVEVENLAALQAVATAINGDATVCPTSPQYVAYLTEGNDVGGIDVGFLVSTRTVAGQPRVGVTSVTQAGALVPFTCPDGSPIPGGGDLLNDRPSLVLEGTISDADGATAPLTAIVNHLRSLSGVNDATVVGGNNACFGTEGNRVREKREQQAEWLANYIHSRQALNAAERIVLVGDFNAFQFNDGYVDSIGIIKGTPAPDNETVVLGDGLDFVNPDFTNLVDLEAPAERYSFLFGGNAQTLDHVLMSQAMVAATSARRIEHARINADFAEDNRNDPTLALRLADHDPAVAFFELVAFNDRPTISDVGDRSVRQGESTGPIAFTVADAETPATQLNVTGSSSNTTLVPNANIVVTAGAGGARDVVVTPATGATGTATITLTVTDADGGSANDTFVLTVVPNQNPTISDVGPQFTNEDTATGAIAFTVGDAETAAASLVVTATSSNTALVPNANIANGGSGANRTVTITPAPNANGTTTITLTVSDGDGGSSADTFVLTVASVNDGPAITAIADRTIPEDGSTGPIPFTISDIDHPLDCDDVAFSSSNDLVVPEANIVIGGGTGQSCTITATPLANAVGQTVIEVSLADGAGGFAAEAFTLTVDSGAAGNDVPTIMGPANQTIVQDSSTAALAVTIGDIETPAANLVLTASSSDTTLVPNASIELGGSGANRTVRVTPAAGRAGTTTITLTVADTDGGSAQATFTVTVTPTGDPIFANGFE